MPKEDIHAQADKMFAVFDRAKDRLINFGFRPDNIAGKITTSTLSRARAILQEAERNGHATIVLGRRGLSKIQEFFMGSVSNKVVQLARDQAVWVVV